MKQAVILALVLASASALAGWEKVTATADATFSLDYSTLVKTEKGVKIRELIDFNQPQLLTLEKKYLSGKNLVEYDCKASKQRLLSFTLYSQTGGAGEVLLDQSPTTDWVNIGKGSPGEPSLKAACGKKPRI